MLKITAADYSGDVGITDLDVGPVFWLVGANLIKFSNKKSALKQKIKYFYFDDVHIIKINKDNRSINVHLYNFVALAFR